MLYQVPISLGTGQKLEGGGGGLVQTWGGPWFFMQAQKGGSNSLVHVIKGGHYFLCKNAGVKESIYNSSVVTVILL